jgi:hypothetical protein
VSNGHRGRGRILKENERETDENCPNEKGRGVFYFLAGSLAFLLLLRDVIKSGNKSNSSDTLQSAPNKQVEDVSSSLGSPKPHVDPRAHGQQNPDRKWNHPAELREYATCLAAIITLIFFVPYVIFTYNQMEAGQKQLAEMRTAKMLDERAWVGYEGDISQETSDTKQFAAFSMHFANTGRTPALNVTSIVVCTSDTNSIPAKDAKNTTPPAAGIVAPNGKAFVETAPLPVQSVAAVSSGRPLYIYGTVWYDDIFKQHHWSQFCIKVSQRAMNGSMINYQPMPFHNSCDDADGKQ